MALQVTPYFAISLAEAGDAGLGGAVVRLADIAEQAAGGGGVHDPAAGVLAGLGLLTPQDAGLAGDQEMAAQVDLDDRVPLLDGHVEDHLVAQDPRVVDDGVELTPGVERQLHQRGRALGLGDVLEMGHGIAPGGLDLLDHLGGGPGVGAGPVPFAADVVHDDARALLREQQRLAAADAASRAGDHGDLAVQHGHG
jgi:hypothetical protein